MSKKKTNNSQQKKREQRKRDRKRRQILNRYKMYIDESGNTGSNLFDENQSYFFCLGTLSKDDLVSLAECTAIREYLQEDEIHGNELGLTKISEISQPLIDIIYKYDLHFLCSEIDKIYYGKMKFFHVIFDSGTNPGVGPVHCFVSTLKWLLMVKFAELVTIGELKHFWTSYCATNVSSFKTLMENMIVRVPNYDADERTKELLLDCYRGAIAKPKEVLSAGLVDSDCPNVTSIVMFIHELNKIFDEKKLYINEVIHDTQKEFGISIEESYKLLHDVKVIWNLEGFKHKQSKVFSPNFHTCDSKDCYGLQLSDVFLYLHKKASEIDLKGNAKMLYETLQSRSHFLFMTKEGLESKTMGELSDLYSRPLTPEHFKEGAKLSKELEFKRKAKLHKSQEG